MFYRLPLATGSGTGGMTGFPGPARAEAGPGAAGLVAWVGKRPLPAPRGCPSLCSSGRPELRHLPAQLVPHLSERAHLGGTQRTGQSSGLSSQTVTFHLQVNLPAVFTILHTYFKRVKLKINFP